MSEEEYNDIEVNSYTLKDGRYVLDAEPTNTEHIYMNFDTGIPDYLATHNTNIRLAEEGNGRVTEEWFQDEILEGDQKE